MMYEKSHSVVISSGNSKIGKIPNISLPPGLSCPIDVPCAKENACYSLKAWRQYKVVRDARLHNWRTWLSEPDRYFENIHEYVEKEKSAYFRFHVDGDIPDENYFKKMIKLASQFSKTRFLAYTKRYELPIDKSPTNLTIIVSAWPGLKLPGSERVAWMEDGREDRYNHANFDCNKKCDECFACWHLYTIGKDVVFHKH